MADEEPEETFTFRDRRRVNADPAPEPPAPAPVPVSTVQMTAEMPVAAPDESLLADDFDDLESSEEGFPGGEGSGELPDVYSVLRCS